MRCLMCHSVEIAVQQRFGPEGWSDTLDRMIKYGAPIPPEDKQRLLASSAISATRPAANP